MSNNTSNHQRGNSSSNKNNNRQNNQNKQSKKRKQDQSNTTNNNNHHRKRKPSESLDSKIARILGTNNNQQQVASASSSSSSEQENYKQNRTIERKTNQTRTGTSSSGSSALPGFYFDSKANRYFPIPKNGLECSLLVGNSEDRMVELETHKLSQLKIRKKIQDSTPIIEPNIVKHHASTLLNQDRKNKFFTHFKSKLIHPSDHKLYNKHVVNRMENFKMLNNLAAIENWEDNYNILKFEEVETDVLIFNYEFVRGKQVLNRNIMVSVDDNYNNYRVQVGQYEFQKENNYELIYGYSFQQKPLYSLLTLNNTSKKKLHSKSYYVIITPKQTNLLCILQMKLDIGKEAINYQCHTVSRNKTVFSHSIHPNNRWCAFGLNKGGMIVDLAEYLQRSCHMSDCTLAYFSNQYSDILITYWNPFITEFGELMYARRDGGLYISHLIQSTNTSSSRNQKPTYSHQEICSLQYGNESFIGQMLSLDENRFLVRSVCKNGISFCTYIHMFDKRKLSSNSDPFQSYILSYDFESPQQQQLKSNNLNTIMAQVDVKMFIHNSRFLICGDSEGWLRVWDIFSGGKPISTKKLQDCYCSEVAFFPSSSNMSEEAGHLLLSLKSTGTSSIDNTLPIAIPII